MVQQMMSDGITGDTFFVHPDVTEHLKCKYGERNFCYNASITEQAMGAFPEIFHTDAKDSVLTLSPGEFVIRLAEQKEVSTVSRTLLLTALASLLFGLFFAWRRRDAFPRPNYKVYDGPIAFVLSLIVGVVLSSLAFKIVPFSGLYIPQTTMTCANFGMFLGLFGVASIYVLIRTFSKDSESMPVLEAPAQVSAASSIIAEDAAPVTVEKEGADQPPSPKVFKMHPMAFAMIAGFILAILAAVSTVFSGSFELDLNDIANQFTSERLALGHFAMLAGISEELLYRGVIQTAIGGRKTHGVRAVLGMVITALLFMSVHIPQSMGHLFTLLPVFCLGLTSGYAKMRTQSIFPSMTMHMTYNTVLLIPSFFV